MPGARCARSLACKIKKHASKSPRSHRKHPAFPARWFYGFFRALPGDRLSCHHPRVMRVLDPTGPTSPSSRVDASVEASGPHDFTVRRRVVRLSTSRRPSHPAPTFCDDRETPLLSGTGRREGVEMICPTGRAKYFCAEEWTVESALMGLGKSGLLRNFAGLSRASERFGHRIIFGRQGFVLSQCGGRCG